MKTEFPKFLKEMRIALHPEFERIVGNSSLSSDQLDQALLAIEAKQEEMVNANGYTLEEFGHIIKDYFIDFSSENPDEWIIREDPANAQIITGKNG
jgi:hypothetical protein